MFTGLVQHVGRVIDRCPIEGGQRLRLDPQGWDYEPLAGASVAVEGCCLSLVQSSEREWSFDVIPQTLRVTTLGSLEAGASVNLEHAALAETLLGGHLVQGHVDCVGVVTAAGEVGDEYRCRVEFDPGYDALVVSRGSVAVSGVSLTVAARGHGWLEVALIPTTLRETTLGGLTGGGRVNLEFDVFAKMIERQLDLRGTDG
ncbi:MAG: riboflavin synthase [Phycisphaerales bacterium]|nr:riboflavin synthase [Phycisphaerales bacterium]